MLYMCNPWILVHWLGRNYLLFCDNKYYVNVYATCSLIQFLYHQLFGLNIVVIKFIIIDILQIFYCEIWESKWFVSKWKNTVRNA